MEADYWRLVVKSLIWTFSLGSDTSGGILAPLLMIGGAMGAAWVMCYSECRRGPGRWFGCIGAGGGDWRSADGGDAGGGVDAQQRADASGAAGLRRGYAVGCAVAERSILTERLSRRGYHLSREYGVDPLETVMVREAMHTSVFALSADATRQGCCGLVGKMDQRGSEAWSHWQRLFPLVDADGASGGVLTRSQMITAARQEICTDRCRRRAIATPAVVGPRETLRSAAEQMAESKLTSFPVVDANGNVGGHPQYRRSAAGAWEGQSAG